MKQMLTKDIIRSVLLDAAQELVARSGSEFVFAAPMATRARELLRVRVGDPELQLTPNVWGPLVFGEPHPIQTAQLRFRNLLEAFPDDFQVFPTQSGDRVQVRTSDSEPVTKLRKKYRQLLCDVLTAIAAERGDTEIPGVQVAKWLKRFDPEFDVRRIGFASLADWCESPAMRDIVALSFREYGGRLRLLPAADPEVPSLMTGNNAAAQASREVQSGLNQAHETSVALNPQPDSGYLLVDSVDALGELHTICGTKPNAGLLPDWAKTLTFCRELLPAENWKALYFLSVDEPSQAASLEGFFSFLRAAGIQPVSLTSDRDTGEPFIDRAATSFRALRKTIRAITERPNAHVVVLSHNPELAEDLKSLIATRKPGAKVGLLTLRDPVPAALQIPRLLLWDLERDARAFRNPLPRARIVSSEHFDPTELL